VRGKYHGVLMQHEVRRLRVRAHPNKVIRRAMKMWRIYEIRNIFVVGDRAGMRLGGRVRDVSRRRCVDSLIAAIRRDFSGDSFV
jgi:hypothetical protein